MRRYLIALAATLLLLPAGVFAYSSPGQPDGYVTDFADILSEGNESTLEELLADLEARMTTEIAVVTVNSLDGDDVAVYGNELFREWGIGQAEADNGILLLVAPNERKMRIEVGYGLEGVVPDITAGAIIDDVITPAFKAGDYDTGVQEGVLALVATVDGEPFVRTSYVSQDKYADIPDWVFAIPFLGIFFLVFFLQILFGLAAILCRSNSWWAGGIVGLVAGIFFTGFFENVVAGGISIMLFTLSGLLFDFLVSRGYQKYHKNGLTPPWYLGGKFSTGEYHSSGGGGFSSGSSGGGSSFGGGSSGGGGASGSW